MIVNTSLHEKGLELSTALFEVSQRAPRVDHGVPVSLVVQILLAAAEL